MPSRLFWVVVDGFPPIFCCRPYVTPGSTSHSPNGLTLLLRWTGHWIWVDAFELAQRRRYVWLTHAAEWGSRVYLFVCFCLIDWLICMLPFPKREKGKRVKRRWTGQWTGVFKDYLEALKGLLMEGLLFFWGVLWGSMAGLLVLFPAVQPGVIYTYGSDPRYATAFLMMQNTFVNHTEMPPPSFQLLDRMILPSWSGTEAGFGVHNLVCVLAPSHQPLSHCIYALWHIWAGTGELCALHCTLSNLFLFLIQWRLM